MAQTHDDLEVIERITRIEEKIDAFLFRTTNTERKVDEHDTRLRNIEQSHAKTLGIGAAILAFLTLFSQYINKMIGG